MCKISAQSVKGNLSAILEGRHIKFIMMSPNLSFSSHQLLSFDTHIKRVAKKKAIRHLGAAAIFIFWGNFIVYILSLMLSFKAVKTALKSYHSFSSDARTYK